MFGSARATDNAKSSVRGLKGETRIRIRKRGCAHLYNLFKSGGCQMGRKSIKEDKNIYQISRENANLTRNQASEQMEYVSADRIEKIESGKSAPHPEEILAMVHCYRNPKLSNYYCSHECPIGQKSVPELELKELTQITLETLSNLAALEKEKDKFIEIAADNKITEEEMGDFMKIKTKLEQIARTADTLQLWIAHHIPQ